MRPLVVVESPYTGDIEENVAYARACMRDAIERGERPFASHLLYTQEGVLRDEVANERKLGIEMGYAFVDDAAYTAFYIDKGLSGGMVKSLERCIRQRSKVVFRRLRV